MIRCIFTLILIFSFSTPYAIHATSNAMCPDKILATNTISGTYLGWFEAEEGFHSIGLQLNNGESVYVAASKDDAEHFFDNHTGSQVSLTYNTKQFWLEEGECLKVDILASGHIIESDTGYKKSNFSKTFRNCLDNSNNSNADTYACYDNEYKRLIDNMQNEIEKNLNSNKSKELLLKNQNKWLGINDDMSSIEEIYAQKALGVTGIRMLLQNKLDRALIRRDWIIDVIDNINEVQ